MTPDRWKEVDRIWHAVLTRPEHERAAAVAELSADNSDVRLELESLLTNLAQASAAGFGSSAVAVPPVSLIGRSLGPYTVRALLGIGGMGEVYRAHDSTLGRDVALKVLPDLWLSDTGWRNRFEREARVLASLNHPNIASIYGVYESEPSPGPDPSIRALVLELVEGETLSDRLARHTGAAARRGLPADEAVSIATRIAEALEAAHARGVVHRDLKPANVKVTPDARVKVLDFGLATAGGSDGTGPDAGRSPATTLDTMQAGGLFGTAPYMSPEQARGHAVDKRTDIWAFGCVLYEMLTGTPPFGGEDVAGVLANVLGAEPDWTALPAHTTPTVRLCLRRCLEKDVRQRFQDIGDVRLALQGAFDVSPGERQARKRGSYPRLMYAGGMAAIAAVALVAFVAWSGRLAQPPLETRLEIVTPPASDPSSIAMSPDGRKVVFEAWEGGVSRLSLRRLESADAQPLAGTDFGTMPFWSPDSRSVGFFAETMLKRIDLADGFVRTLSSAPHPRRGTWNRDGTIVFGPVAMGPLQSVSAEGGPTRPATQLLKGQTSHRWPQFLPDGRRFLLMALGTPDVRGVYLGSLDETTVRRLSDRDSAFWFVAPDHLLTVRDGALFARRLTGGHSRVGDESLAVAPKVLISGVLTGYAAMATSSNGHIAYRSSAPYTQLVWLDRSGHQTSAIGEPDDSQPEISDLSPDGRTVAVQRMVNGNSDVWLVDTARGVPRRLTDDPGFDGAAIFSADGRRVVYMSDASADVWDTVHERAADGTGATARVFAFDRRDNHYPTDASPDGRFILYAHETGETQFDLWALPLAGKRTPIQVARTPFVETGGKFSPDGGWVAYISNETGRFELYVQPFPGLAAKSQVSVTGGFMPQWRQDGRELFFVGPGNQLMSVPVVRRGSSLETGEPRVLFTFPERWAGSYRASPDGQRFLIITVVKDASPITAILNWNPASR